jgi:hypothetical protein
MRQHYNHLTHTAKEEKEAELKRWVEQHSAEEIKLANHARARLRAKLESSKGKNRHSKWPPIRDERSAKRPVSTFLQFSINRQNSGDFHNIKVTERAKLIGQEWKALSQEEKDVSRWRML